MKSAHDLAGLIKFSRREPWCDILHDVLEEHLGDALDAFGRDYDGLSDLIGEQWRATLWGCAFEDMLIQK